MARSFEVDLIWQGRAVHVRGTAYPPEPDVGIFGPTIEELIVTDKGTGQEISLTEEQFRELEDRAEISRTLEEGYYGVD